MDLGSPSSWFSDSARITAVSFNPALKMSWRSFFQEPRPASHMPYIGTRATNMVSALVSTSGTPPGGCLIKINRSNEHPWKYAFVMSPDLIVRRSHETHDRLMFNPSMSQVGESVLTPVVSSRSPRLTNRLLKPLSRRLCSFLSISTH